MRIVAAMNMTLDAYCDHTSGFPDAELHDHYAELLASAEVILYGRKTYELMTFWQGLVDEPSGEPSMDAFAKVMDRCPKLVFSRSMKSTTWQSARIAQESLEAEVQRLRSTPGGNAYVGSPGLIAQLTELDLFDEYRICIHRMIAGGGLRLFPELPSPRTLQLTDLKRFQDGAVVLCYSVQRESV